VIRTVILAAALVLTVVFMLSSPAGAARPLHPCSKAAIRLSKGEFLSASTVRPSCVGAALMASDIYYDASQRFPRDLPRHYVAYAHGTNTAGDPSARYPCTISNRFIKTRDGEYRRTTAVCTNIRGDGFRYVFDMA
jgi:hypothetical protein